MIHQQGSITVQTVVGNGISEPSTVSVLDVIENMLFLDVFGIYTKTM